MGVAQVTEGTRGREGGRERGREGGRERGREGGREREEACVPSSLSHSATHLNMVKKGEHVITLIERCQMGVAQVPDDTR